MPLLRTTHPFPDAIFGLWQIAESEEFFRADLPLSASEEFDLSQHQNPLRRLEWLAGRWLLHKLTDAPERLPLAKDAFSKPFFPENQDLACSLSHSKGNVGALIVHGQQSTVNSQKLKVNSQKSIVKSQQSTVNSQKSKVNSQQSTVNGQQSTVNSQQSTVKSQKSTVNSHQSIGCDIQVLTEKMHRIAHKFLNDAEKDFVKNRPFDEELELLHLFWTAKESLYKAYGLKELDFRKNLFVTKIQWDGIQGEGIGRVEKGGFRQEFQLIFSKIVLPEGTELLSAVCQEG